MHLYIRMFMYVFMVVVAISLGVLIYSDLLKDYKYMKRKTKNKEGVRRLKVVK